MLPVSGYSLVQLIPQKHPFVLIDVLHDVKGNTCNTSFTVQAEHVLCENGKLSMAGLLENMAQSSGCKLGYEDFTAGKMPRRGFIGEMKDLVCLRLPKAGEELNTKVTVESTVYGAVTIISAQVSVGDSLVASCRMKIFFN